METLKPIVNDVTYNFSERDDRVLAIINELKKVHKNLRMDFSMNKKGEIIYTFFTGKGLRKRNILKNVTLEEAENYIKNLQYA